MLSATCVLWMQQHQAFMARLGGMLEAYLGVTDDIETDTFNLRFLTDEWQETVDAADAFDVEPQRQDLDVLVGYERFARVALRMYTDGAPNAARETALQAGLQAARARFERVPKVIAEPFEHYMRIRGLTVNLEPPPGTPQPPASSVVRFPLLCPRHGDFYGVRP